MITDCYGFLCEIALILDFQRLGFQSLNIPETRGTKDLACVVKAFVDKLYLNYLRFIQILNG